MASNDQILPKNWSGTKMRDPTTTMAAQPSFPFNDARSTNRCSNASLQGSVYARWASCYRLTWLPEKKNSNRERWLLSQDELAVGYHFLHWVVLKIYETIIQKKNENFYQVSCFFPIFQFICKRFLSLSLWSCLVLYLLSFLVKATANPKHELNSLIKSEVIRKRSNSPR